MIESALTSAPLAPESVPPKQVVWGLYANYTGGNSRLSGIFSSAELVKSCQLIQPLLREAWEYRDLGEGNGIWQARALDREQPKDRFHFTVEPIEVDRLVEP